MFATIADLPGSVKLTVPEAAQEIFRKAFNAGATREYSLNGWVQGYLAVEKAGYEERDGRFLKLEASDQRFAIPLKVAGAVDDAIEDPLIRKLAIGQPITKDEVLKLAGIYEGDDETLIEAHGGAKGRKWITRLLRKIAQDGGGQSPAPSNQPNAEQKRKEEGLPLAIVSLRGKISKVDEDRRLVFGWFSVSSEDGKTLVDSQQDTISEDEMEKMAYDVVRNRIKAGFTGGEMHQNIGVGELVELMVFTTEKQKVLGIDLGKVGVWGGFYVNDDDTWEGVKSGKYKGFSISGTGRRSATGTAA